jgi:hypothetical protein
MFSLSVLLRASHAATALTACCFLLGGGCSRSPAVAQVLDAYSTAYEKCDPKPGENRDVCIAAAKAAKSQALAEARHPSNRLIGFEPQTTKTAALAK